MGRPTSPLDDMIPEGMRISRLVVVTGTVPLPGAGYERVNEFHAESWRIEPVGAGYRVSRGEQVLDIFAVPMVVVYETIPGLVVPKRDRT